MIELLENNNINKYIIELIESIEYSYKPFYSQDMVELKTIKVNIEIHLKTSFIYLLMLLIGVSILFYKKTTGSFCLNVNYQALNN